MAANARGLSFRLCLFYPRANPAQASPRPAPGSPHDTSRDGSRQETPLAWRAERCHACRDTCPSSSTENEGKQPQTASLRRIWWENLRFDPPDGCLFRFRHYRKAVRPGRDAHKPCGVRVRRGLSRQLGPGATGDMTNGAARNDPYAARNIRAISGSSVGISPVAPGPRWRLRPRACSCASSNLTPSSYPVTSARQSLLSRARELHIPPVATANHVIHSPRILDAQLARHAAIQGYSQTTVNSQDDPFIG